MLAFKVSAQYARGPEQVIADFKNLDDAKLFIAGKLDNDARLRVPVSYLVYDLGELIERFEPGQAGSDSGQSQSNANTFRPSPLQTTPRPSGMPNSGFKSDNKDDDKDKY